jgi:hypothetical protein
MSEAAPNQQAPVNAGQAPVEGQAPVVSTESKPWYDGYKLAPEDVGYIQNKGWKESPTQVLNAYKNLEKFHGVPAEQLLKLPKSNDDQAGWDSVYTKLGRPAKAEDYGEFKAPEGVDASFVNTERVKWADGVAHKLGFTKAQRDGLLAATFEYEHSQYSDVGKQIELAQTAQLQELKKEWGAAFDERSELGRRAVRAFLPGNAEQNSAMLNAIEGAIGTAAVLKLFSNIGQKIGEDKIPETGIRPFGYTPEQAKSDIQQLKIELQGSKERLAVYNQGKGPDYEKMKKLNQIAHGQA